MIACPVCSESPKPAVAKAGEPTIRCRCGSLFVTRAGWIVISVGVPSIIDEDLLEKNLQVQAKIITAAAARMKSEGKTLNPGDIRLMEEGLRMKHMTYDVMSMMVVGTDLYISPDRRAGFEPGTFDKSGPPTGWVRVPDEQREAVVRDLMAHIMTAFAARMFSE